MITSIFKPGQTPIRGLRTSLAGSQLPDGYFSKIDGLRWDTGVFKVRDGLATVSSSAPSSVCLGAWSGALNGIQYCLGAWLVANSGVYRTCVFSLNLTTGALTELTVGASTTRPGWGGTGTTSAGAAAGETRIGSPVAISGATAASPIVVTTGTNHGFLSGDKVAIYGVTGLSGANGLHTVTKLTDTTFSLDGSTGTGSYSSGSDFAVRYGPVTFCVHTFPRKIEGTQDSTPKDVLTINSGSDWALRYDPQGYGDIGYAATNLTFVKDIRIPPGGEKGLALGTHTAFWQVATAAAAKTFANVAANGTTPQTRFKAIDSAVFPYNGAGGTSPSDRVIDIVTEDPVALDSARIDFGAGEQFYGEQISFTVQATAGNLSNFLANNKVEVGPTTTPYTIYDPTSADPNLTIPPIQTALDIGNNRIQITFSLKNVPVSARNLRYLKFTRLSSETVGPYTVTILSIAGTGAGAGFFGGTEFANAYSDIFSGAESRGIVMVNQGYDLLRNVGGPSVVTSGSGVAAGAKIAGSPQVLYDYRLDIQNAEHGIIYGGFSSSVDANYGWPSHADIYFRTAEESLAGSDFLYFQSFPFYGQVDAVGDKQWRMFEIYTSDATLGGTPKLVISVNTCDIGAQGIAQNVPPDRTLRDPGTPLPSAFNIAMPRAFAVATANQRTFVGAVRDTAANAYVFSDLYFSALSHPFRFAALQESETSASRVTFAGERVRAIIMTAAAANGASTIYVLTDRALYGLGTAGGFVGSGYDATALGTAVRISNHGTNEPFSVCERSGTIFYIDQESQAIRFRGGYAKSISRNTVDDIFKAIPGALRGTVSAEFWKDRWYLALPPAGGTANTRILGWNDVLEEWEFFDTLPSGVIATKIARTFDGVQIGSGQRLFLYGSSDSKIYSYEEGTTEPGSAVGPAMTLRTREFQSPNLDLLRINKVQVMIDAQTATLNVDRCYKPRDSRFRTTIDCSDAESKPKAIKQDTRIPVEQTSTNKPEDGWSAFIDFTANLGAGKTIWRIEAEIDGLSKGAGER